MSSVIIIGVDFNATCDRLTVSEVKGISSDVQLLNLMSKLLLYRLIVFDDLKRRLVCARDIFDPTPSF